ncbi:MAG: F0F1 ATP synthase subunit delta [Treponema sp.]|jgi:F-type H+-transporting ATPase subunit delta|nr:F0F1 ATP synthase subunit delta [Treponema sp.]
MPGGLLSNRWAAAFIGACGTGADSGFLCLKAMVPALKAIPGGLFGQGAALRLEGLLREGLGDLRSAPEAEYAVRFLSLLVRKNLFRRHIDSIVRQIERRLDAQKGILEAVLECAAPPEGGFEEYLKSGIKKRTGAPEIRLLICRKPEILGGYRLRIGGFCVDASLKGLLANMAKELEHG